MESNVDHQTAHEHLATQTNDQDYKRSVEKLKSYQHAKINKVNRDIRQLRKHFAEKSKLTLTTVSTYRTLHKRYITGRTKRSKQYIFQQRYVTITNDK